MKAKDIGLQLHADLQRLGAGSDEYARLSELIGYAMHLEARADAQEALANQLRAETETARKDVAEWKQRAESGRAAVVLSLLQLAELDESNGWDDAAMVLRAAAKRLQQME